VTRVVFEPATLRTQGTKLTTEPPRSKIYSYIVLYVCAPKRFCSSTTTW